MARPVQSASAAISFEQIHGVAEDDVPASNEQMSEYNSDKYAPRFPWLFVNGEPTLRIDRVLWKDPDTGDVAVEEFVVRTFPPKWEDLF